MSEGRWQRLRRIGRLFIILALVLGLVGWLLWEAALAWVIPDYSGRVRAAVNAGGALLDRDGRILRLFPNADEEFLLSSPPASFPELLCQAVLAAEDRRFYEHAGFDPWAIARAFWLNLRHQRVISGASTITQQVIRMVRPASRTILTKIVELLLAARLERSLSKTEIMTAYLNLAPMGGNVRGAPLAARVFWGKSLDQLTCAEAATLAGIPQAPSRLDPNRWKGHRLLKKRRNWILQEMRGLGFISGVEEKQGRAAPVWASVRRFPFAAPHFCDWVVSQLGRISGWVTTTIDLDLQTIVEETLQAHEARLRRSGAGQAAALVVDTRTMQVLAMMGSLRFGPLAGGYNNGCVSPRSGGSVLKPFLYALALEQGFHPCSVIPDTRQHFQTPQGDYLPLNADRRAYGPVTIRQALGNSLNISAVKMLNIVGVAKMYKLLVDLELLKPEPNGPDKYGLGLAIGNPEIRMIDLVQAYGVLAHHGNLNRLAFMPGPSTTVPGLFSEESAFLILDMLSDPTARLLTFGNPRYFSFDGPVALKTGTSTDYRDCWLVAVTPRYIVGLWVGNFEGRPTYGLSGASACGPILRDLLQNLPGALTDPWFRMPRGIREIPICGISGQTPTPFCDRISRELVSRDSDIPAACTFHTSNAAVHELPMEYADWLQQRRLTLQDDPYTLTQGIATPDPLRSSMLLPAPVGSGVRVRAVQPPRFAWWPYPFDQLASLSWAAGDLARWEGQPRNFPASAAIRPQGMTGVREDLATKPARITVSQAKDQTMMAQVGRITIVQPHDRDRFVLVPGQENITRFRAVPEEPLPEIIWLIDGRELARTPPPYEFYWTMEKGRHEIAAIGPGEQGSSVVIDVE